MSVLLARRFATAATVMREDQGLATVGITGRISGAVSIELLAACEADLGVLGACGLVADYSGADLQIDAERLLGCASLVMDGGALLRMPTSLVVRADDMPLWRLYCELQGQKGVLRRAFTSGDLARRWAAEYASLWAAQARFRERGRSG